MPTRFCAAFATQTSTATRPPRTWCGAVAKSQSPSLSGVSCTRRRNFGYERGQHGRFPEGKNLLYRLQARVGKDFGTRPLSRHRQIVEFIKATITEIVHKF
ncbi:hypothetical protein CHS0354_017892 [Potamilus streckersoni]|uniref:Uncharacterized protein n=1 Tax=Potamilus streckersoni TaxID=2493646 RepID=A0AAE0T384_9BIVA|nr:hypothetical protein CHS0354_017892 [Potamilus streckersoni]